MDYEAILKPLTLEVVYFDNGATPESMAAYVLVRGFNKTQLKHKGTTVLDVGNALYSIYGIIYEMCPEFSRKGEDKNSLAFYISKASMAKMPNIQTWLLELFNEGVGEKTKRWEHVLYCLHKINLKHGEPTEWSEITYIENYHDMGAGFRFVGQPGIFDSYISALAAQSGYWNEYCDYHRCRK